MSYLLMVSHGMGRRYVWGHLIESILKATELATQQARYLNENKSPRAPKVKVSVLRIVGEYDGKS